MHLTLIISSLNSGGAERVMSELANYWVTQGHQVSLVTLTSPKSQPFYFLDPSIKLIQLNLSYPNASSPFARLRDILRRVSCLRKTLQKLTPDVVLSFVDVMNMTALIATIGLKIPVIISERIDPNFHILPKLYAWLRPKLYPLCVKLIVQTESSACFFPSKFKKFMQIIPNPVLFPRNQRKEKFKQVKNIVTIGRLAPQKDHTILIYSFSQLLHFHPHLNLTIYGEGEERSNLEQLIVSLGLQGKVSLPGTTKNVHEILMNADLFIFPSQYEGFPNALGEAMAVGLPVIASNCSGNIDIIRDKIDGRLFPVGDIDALTEVARELLNDPAQCQLLATNARTITERFSPEHIFSLWDQVLLEAVKRRSF